MKATINITTYSEREYNEFVVNVLLSKGFEQIGTRLFEDERSYVRITIKK